MFSGLERISASRFNFFGRSLFHRPREYTRTVGRIPLFSRYVHGHSECLCQSATIDSCSASIRRTAHHSSNRHADRTLGRRFQERLRIVILRGVGPSIGCRIIAFYVECRALRPGERKFLERNKSSGKGATPAGGPCSPDGCCGPGAC